MQNMGEKTLRLVFPQWQGADIVRIVPELAPHSAAHGYVWGSRILDLLLPKAQDEVLHVPIDMSMERTLSSGVMDRARLAIQTKDALKLLRLSRSTRVLTLGGECSVSVAPFSYLQSLYPEDTALLWLDAHPDITLPGDPYAGYHAMALSALLGRGDSSIIAQLPAVFKPQQVLLLGLRDWERETIRQRQQEWGLTHLGPAALQHDFTKLDAWLQACPCRKVVVHFDLDVLDPSDLFCAAGKCADWLTLARCVELIAHVAACKDLVGLTVAELLPRQLLRLRDMLTTLPLIAPRV